jgi:hypothetical protein
MTASVAASQRAEPDVAAGGPDEYRAALRTGFDIALTLEAAVLSNLWTDLFVLPA